MGAYPGGSQHVALVLSGLDPAEWRGLDSVEVVVGRAGLFLVRPGMYCPVLFGRGEVEAEWLLDLEWKKELGGEDFSTEEEVNNTWQRRPIDSNLLPSRSSPAGSRPTTHPTKELHEYDVYDVPPGHFDLLKLYYGAPRDSPPGPGKTRSGPPPSTAILASPEGLGQPLAEQHLGKLENFPGAELRELLQTTARAFYASSSTCSANIDEASSPSSAIFAEHVAINLGLGLFPVQLSDLVFGQSDLDGGQRKKHGCSVDRGLIMACSLQ